MYSIANAPQRLNEQSADQKARLGDLLVAEDGRIYRYTKAGAVDILGAALVQGTTDETSSHIVGKTIGAGTSGEGAAVNSRRMSITATTTSFAANYFSEGYFGSSIAGEAAIHQVSGHPALTASSAGDVNLMGPMATAMTVGTARGFIYRNLYDGVIITPSSGPTKPVLGVTQRNITAGNYFWLLVRGFTACRRSGTLVEGQFAMPSTATAGALAPWAMSVTVTGDPETATITPGLSFPVAMVAGYSATFSTAGLFLLNCA